MNDEERRLNCIVYDGMRIDLINAYSVRKSGIAIRLKDVVERRSRELQAQGKHKAAERVLDGGLKAFADRQ